MGSQRQRRSVVRRVDLKSRAWERADGGHHPTEGPSHRTGNSIRPVARRHRARNGRSACESHAGNCMAKRRIRQCATQFTHPGRTAVLKPVGTSPNHVLLPAHKHPVRFRRGLSIRYGVQRPQRRLRRTSPCKWGWANAWRCPRSVPRSICRPQCWTPQSVAAR